MGETSTAFALVGQTVKRIKISDIVIKERQRKMSLDDKEFVKHIDDLAASIRRAGLIHPITLEDESNVLVAGFCRIQAFLKLGHEEIPFVRRSELDEMQRKVIELEENLQRLGLPWWMEAAAIAEIDSLQRRLHPDEWNQRKTAEIIGESVGKVNQAIQVAEEIRLNPNLVKDSKTLQSALNSIKNKKQIEKRKAEIELKKKGRIKTFPAQILLGRAEELIKEQPDEEFDAIITNFPFGIDLEFSKSGVKPYYDEEQYIIDTVQTVVKEGYRVLKNDSWFVAFFDVRKITYSNHQLALYKQIMALESELEPEVWKNIHKTAFDSMGLTFWMKQAGFNYVQLMPAIWVKPNKTQGTIGDPKKGMIVAYEAFVLAAKGDAFLLKQGLQNIFIYDTPPHSERVHELQMSEELCTRLVSMVALGGSKILDPFAGSGAVGQGALNNQCEFLGFELDKEKHEKGNMLLQEHIFAREEAGNDD